MSGNKQRALTNLDMRANLVRRYRDQYGAPYTTFAWVLDKIRAEIEAIEEKEES